MSWFMPKPTYNPLWELAKKLLKSNDDNHSPEPSDKKRLASSKGSRTKARKKMIRNILVANRQKLRAELLDSLQTDFPRFSDVTCEFQLGKLVVDFNGVGYIQAAMDMLASKFDVQINQSATGDMIEIEMTPIDDVVKKALAKANDQYGELCGFNYDNEYNQADDAYLKSISRLLPKHSTQSSNAM
ncbi:hypothetical protein ACFL6Z_03820 [Pseudomonadota bacterium]|uniref:hypothetical protein n=1 Tax=Shewanella sp. 6_MG-2023 TaxID=3062660 RepID=UPI0026E2CFC8|nr:hypothetical protein [Shewanella sp. 6_MG-2023]MDO6620225.1 hypothetical protein [Shewanella sp. 6_MG-2023]